MPAMWLALSAVMALATALPSPSNCHIEDSDSRERYASHWNSTTNLVCDSRSRPERVCVVGAGVSGAHFAWLAARRGFSSVTVFEALDRVGGKAHTLTGGVGGDPITRDAGAEFLSPDYVETRALVRRFGLTELPISRSQDIRFHTSNGSVTTSAAWANAWIANITGSSDAAANARIVAAALERYIAIHHSIFGNSSTRLPPMPTPAAMRLMRGTTLDFLARNNLRVLEPLFYQFFVMQGQGLLDRQPAFYALRWVNPTSLMAPCFGDNPDTCVAVIKEGMGSIVSSLLRDANITLRLNTTITSIERSGPGPVRVSYRSSTTDDSGECEAVVGEAACDVLVLTGPIPRFVRGSDDGSVRPILSDPTPDERDLFAQMQPMQYLSSVVDLEPSPDEFRAIEYWPDAFSEPSAVIVRRNIRYVETNASGPIGGIMSYSYSPAPVANRSTHWQSQQQWASAQGRAFSKVFAQLWCDTYYYHYYNGSDIEAGKPWRIRDDIQYLPDVRTIYVGGAANYETVEDSIYFNLYLVNRLFDRRSV